MAGAGEIRGSSDCAQLSCNMSVKAKALLKQEFYLVVPKDSPFPEQCKTRETGEINNKAERLVCLMCGKDLDKRFHISHISGDGSNAGGTSICRKMPKKAFAVLAQYPDEFPKAKEIHKRMENEAQNGEDGGAEPPPPGRSGKRLKQPKVHEKFNQFDPVKQERCEKQYYKFIVRKLFGNKHQSTKRYRASDYFLEKMFKEIQPKFKAPRHDSFAAWVAEYSAALKTKRQARLDRGHPGGLVIDGALCTLENFCFQIVFRRAWRARTVYSASNA